MNFIHTSNESHHLEGEIHQGGEKGQKAGEYLIHFHQKSEGKVNLGIDSSKFHFLLVPQCEKVATSSVTVPVGQIFVTKVWVREYTICTLFHITQSDSIPFEVLKPLKSN